MATVKPVTFVGNSLAALRKFPADARQDAGYQVYKLQRGEQPGRFQAIAGHWQWVEEIRIWTDEGTFRVLYVARLPEAVYVLHAFQKKTQATRRADLELAQKRFRALQVARPKKPKA